MSARKKTFLSDCRSRFIISLYLKANTKQFAGRIYSFIKNTMLCWIALKVGRIQWVAI